MKKGDMRRAGIAQLQRTKVHMIVCPIFGIFLVPRLYEGFVKLPLLAALISYLPFILAGIVLTYSFWRDVICPWYELLCKGGLVERTVHINSKRLGEKRFGHDVCYIKSCEVREALEYHRSIPDDFIVDNRLTIGYLPKSCIILYVDKPAD